MIVVGCGPTIIPKRLETLHRSRLFGVIQNPFGVPVEHVCKIGRLRSPERDFESNARKLRIVKRPETAVVQYDLIYYNLHGGANS